MGQSNRAQLEKIADQAAEQIRFTSKSEREAFKGELDYAQKHFFFIAEQRLKLFNYYTIVVAASIGAGVKFLDGTAAAMSIALLGATSVIVAQIFEIIDLRNIRLLLLARRALAICERSPFCPRHLKLITLDTRKKYLLKQISRRRPNPNLWRRLRVYTVANASITTAIQWAYSTHKAVGLIMIAYSLFAPAQKPDQLPVFETRLHFDSTIPAADNHDTKKNKPKKANKKKSTPQRNSGSAAKTDWA